MNRFRAFFGLLLPLLSAALMAVSCTDKEQQSALEKEVKTIDTYVENLANSGKEL